MFLTKVKTLPCVYTVIWNNVSNGKQLLSQQCIFKTIFMFAPFMGIIDFRIQTSNK